jgi:hypothetical protein
MQIREDLIFGDSLIEKKKETILSIEKETDGKLVLICPSLNPKDMLDLYPAKVVYSIQYLKDNLEIRGVAADHDECLELVRRLSEEAVNKTGNADLRSYLSRGNGEAVHGDGATDP